MVNTAPIQLSLAFRQGETWVTGKYIPVDDDGKAFDLTSATAHMQAKSSASASSAVLDITDSSGIVLDDTDSSFHFDVTDTATFAVAAGVYVFDMFIKLASGRRVLAAKGTLRVDAAVTADP